MSTRVATAAATLKREAEAIDEESKKLRNTGRRSKITTQKRRKQDDSSVKIDKMPAEWADEGEE